MCRGCAREAGQDDGKKAGIKLHADLQSWCTAYLMLLRAARMALTKPSGTGGRIESPRDESASTLSLEVSA